MTEALGDLIEAATGLTVAIDPIRPPNVPGAVVGPPTMEYVEPDAPLVFRGKWRLGLMVPVADDAWGRLAVLAEYVVTALRETPLPFETENVVAEVASVQQGMVPCYRIDVAAWLPASMTAAAPEGRDSAGNPIVVTEPDLPLVKEA